MNPLQDFTLICRGVMYYAQVIQMPDGTFRARVTEGCDPEEIPVLPLYHPVGDITVANAEIAFGNVLRFVRVRIQPNGDGTLETVINPDACELLPIEDQNRIIEEVLGHAVEVAQNQ